MSALHRICSSVFSSPGTSYMVHQLWITKLKKQWRKMAWKIWIKKRGLRHLSLGYCWVWPACLIMVCLKFCRATSQPMVFYWSDWWGPWFLGIWNWGGHYREPWFFSHQYFGHAGKYSHYYLTPELYPHKTWRHGLHCTYDGIDACGRRYRACGTFFTNMGLCHPNQ